MMGRNGERRQMREKQSTAHASFSNDMQIPVSTLLLVLCLRSDCPSNNLPANAFLFADILSSCVCDCVSVLRSCA